MCVSHDIRCDSVGQIRTRTLVILLRIPKPCALNIQVPKLVIPVSTCEIGPFPFCLVGDSKTCVVTSLVRLLHQPSPSHTSTIPSARPNQPITLHPHRRTPLVRRFSQGRSCYSLRERGHVATRNIRGYRRGHGSASEGCGRRPMRDGQRDDSRQGPALCGRRYSPRAVPEEWWKNGSGVDGRSCVVGVGAKSSVDKSSVDRSGVDERSRGCCFALVGGCTEKAVLSARGRIGVRVPGRFATRVPSRTKSMARAPGPWPDDH